MYVAGYGVAFGEVVAVERELLPGYAVFAPSQMATCGRVVFESACKRIGCGSYYEFVLYIEIMKIQDQRALDISRIAKVDITTSVDVVMQVC